MTENNDDYSKIKEDAVDMITKVTIRLFEEAIKTEDFADFLIKNKNLADRGLSVAEGKKFSYNDTFYFLEEIMKNELLSKQEKIKKTFFKMESTKNKEIEKLEENKVDEMDKFLGKITTGLDNYVSEAIDKCENNNDKMLIYQKIYTTLQKLNESIADTTLQRLGESESADINRVFCGMVGGLEKLNERINHVQNELGEEAFGKKLTNLNAKVGNKIIENMKLDELVSTLELLGNLKKTGKELESELDGLKSEDKRNRVMEDLKNIQEQMELLKETKDIFEQQLNFLDTNIKDFNKLTQDSKEKGLVFKNLESMYREYSLTDKSLEDLYSMMQKWQEVSEKIKDSEVVDKEFKEKLNKSIETWNTEKSKLEEAFLGSEKMIINNENQNISDSSPEEKVSQKEPEKVTEPTTQPETKTIGEKGGNIAIENSEPTTIVLLNEFSRNKKLREEAGKKKDELAKKKIKMERVREEGEKLREDNKEKRAESNKQVKEEDDKKEELAEEIIEVVRQNSKKIKKDFKEIKGKIEEQIKQIKYDTLRKEFLVDVQQKAFLKLNDIKDKDVSKNYGKYKEQINKIIVGMMYKKNEKARNI